MVGSAGGFCFLGSVGVLKGDSSVVEGGTGEMKRIANVYDIQALDAA